MSFFRRTELVQESPSAIGGGAKGDAVERLWIDRGPVPWGLYLLTLVLISIFAAAGYYWRQLGPQLAPLGTNGEASPLKMFKLTALLFLAWIVPLAMLYARNAVRAARYAAICSLEHLFKNVPGLDSLTAFEVVKIRYSPERARAGSVLPYLPTTLIFSGISVLGFFSAFFLAGRQDVWQRAMFPLAALSAFDAPAGAGMASPDLWRYQWQAANAMTFAFFGGYVWSLLYLMRRVANFDLAPSDFLRCAVQIIFAGFTVAAVWQMGNKLIDGVSPALLLPFAFVIGFAPMLGLNYLIRIFPSLQMKKIDEAAGSFSPAMPLTMIDGIDWFSSFRLAVYEIEDVQNLATENPFELFVSTPYSFAQILDWIGQAQLLAELGATSAAALRRLGIRQLQDLSTVREHASLRQAAMAVLLANTTIAADDEDAFGARCALLGSRMHVQRMGQIGAAILQRQTLLDCPTQGCVIKLGVGRV